LAGKPSSQEDGLPRRSKPARRETRQTSEPEKIHYRKNSGTSKKNSKGKASSRASGCSQRRIQAKQDIFPESAKRSLRSCNADNGTKTLSDSRNIFEAGESGCSQQTFDSKSPETENADQKGKVCCSGQTELPQVCVSKSQSCGPLSLQDFVYQPTPGKAKEYDKKTRDISLGNGAKKRTTAGMSKIIHHTEHLMQCLVKSSIGVQNAVFPHFLAAGRSSKTTQLNPEDLVQADASREDIHATHKLTTLPLPEGESPSRRKPRKRFGRKNNLALFTRVRGGKKNDSTRKAPFVNGISTPKSHNKRCPPLPDSTINRNVDPARPTTQLRPKPVKKKVPGTSPRTACTTNIPLIQTKPFRVLRKKRTEDGSGSELVSLFRANTRGSSIQSIKVDSSTSVLRLKVAGLLKDALPSKQRSPGKASPLQSRNEDDAVQGTAKKDDQKSPTQLRDSRRRGCTPVEAHSNKNSPRQSCAPKGHSLSESTPKSAQNTSNATASLIKTPQPSREIAQKPSSPTRRKDVGFQPRSGPALQRRRRDSVVDQRSAQQLYRLESPEVPVPTDSPKLSRVLRSTPKSSRETVFPANTEISPPLVRAESQTMMPSTKTEKPSLLDLQNAHGNDCAVFKVTAMDNQHKLKSSQNQRGFGSVPESKEDVHSRSKSVSNCSCKIHCGYSISATSMIPAVGSYEDKIALRNSRKENSAGVTFLEKLPPSRHTLENLDILQISEVTERAPNGITSGNTIGTISISDLDASNTCLDVPVRWQKDPPKLNSKHDEVQDKVKPDKIFQENIQSSGVVCKSRPGIAPPQPSCVEDYHFERRRLTRAVIDRSNDTTSLTGVPLSLQDKNSVQRRGCSAANMAIGGGSSYDSSEACCLASIHSRDVSLLTEAISTISSIPEDTPLPKKANSNSSLVDVSYFSNILCHCRCCDNFLREEPTPLKREIVYEEIREIEPVGLKIPNEFCRRYQGRAPAAMHVSWDAMSTFCPHSKCSRCGAHKKQGADLCQPLFAYDRQENLCEQRRNRGGRCCIDQWMDLPGRGTWHQDHQHSNEISSPTHPFHGDDSSVPNRFAVTSLWPTLLPTPGTSRPDTSMQTFNAGHRIKPRLTLSPVYTTSLPENVQAKSFNKDIVLQRIANLLASRSSIESMDSNQVGFVERNL